MVVRASNITNNRSFVYNSKHHAYFEEESFAEEFINIIIGLARNNPASSTNCEA